MYNGSKTNKRKEVIFISWFVYVLQCRGDTLYTGVTNDLDRRLAEHRQGRGAKYTRGRTPIELLGALEVDSRSLAQAEEHRIKNMKRPDKLKEIASWPCHPERLPATDV